MGRRQRAAIFAAAVIIAAIFPQQSAALSWRLFAGREECFTEYMPDAQWEFVRNNVQNPDQAPVFVDIGFLVTSKYGTEDTNAAVDWALYAPNGDVVSSESGVNEGEYGEVTRGSRGPWRACFRVSSGSLLRPSVTVQIHYFQIHYEEFLGESFEWEEEPHQFDPQDLGTKEQIESLEHGLLRLDHYLMNVTHEQRFLYSRTVRHLRTAESTLRRTFWYYLAIYSVICLASFSQLVVVRMMFKKSRKQGLII